MAITRRQRGTRLQRLGAQAKGTPPAKYRREGAKRRSQYADPKRYKYPVDKPDRVRAALSYFGDAKNRAEYSEAEQRAIARRIVAAARRFKIAVDPSSAVGRLAGLKGEGGGSSGSTAPKGASGRVAARRGRIKGAKK